MLDGFYPPSQILLAKVPWWYLSLIYRLGSELPGVEQPVLSPVILEVNLFLN